MLVLQGTTPEETRNSIVEFLEQEALRYTRSANHQKLKRDLVKDIARSRAMLNAANDIRDCKLADLKN